MAEFTIVKGGQEYLVKNVNNEQEAVAKFKAHIGGGAETPKPQSELGPFLGALPFAQTGEQIAKTGSPQYTTQGPEGYSRLGSDIATGAGAVAAGVGAGAAGAPLLPVLGGLGGGALAGAGANWLMEKTGAAPGLRRGAESIRGATIPKILREPETQSVPLNFLLQMAGAATPGGVAALGAESLPLLASGYAGAKGAVLGSKAPGMAGSALSRGSQMSQAARDLIKYGGEPTAAAMTGGQLAKTAEFSARTNPLLQLLGTFKGKDLANAQAAQKFAESNFGSDIQQGVRPAIGETMRGLLDELAGRRAAKYEPAVTALEQAKGFPNYSKSLLTQLEQAADSLNVTDSAKKAFINSAKESLKGKNTPLAVDKALTDIRIKFSEKLPSTDRTVLNQLDRDFGSMMGELKKANYNALNKIQPGLGDEIAQAKGEYAGASEVISPMAKVMKARGSKPEAIMADILNQGSEGIQNLMAELTPSEKAAFQREFSRFILEESKGSAGPSGAKIKSALATRYKDISPVVGGKGVTDLGRLADMMEAAKIGELYTQNPSGSAVTGMGGLQLGALLNPETAKALGAKTALVDIPYGYAGAPIAKGAMALKGMAGKMLGKGTQGVSPTLRAAIEAAQKKGGALQAIGQTVNAR